MIREVSYPYAIHCADLLVHILKEKPSVLCCQLPNQTRVYPE